MAELEDAEKPAPARQPGSVNEESYAAAGYKGVQIELPAVEHYLQELQDGPVRSVTAHLAGKLYPAPTRNPLPNSIRSYYLGPAVKTLHGSIPDLPPAPSSAAKYNGVESKLHSPARTTATTTATRPHATTAEAQTAATQGGLTDFEKTAPTSAVDVHHSTSDRLRIFEPLPPIPRRHSPPRRHTSTSPSRADHTTRGVTRTDGAGLFADPIEQTVNGTKTDAAEVSTVQGQLPGNSDPAAGRNDSHTNDEGHTKEGTPDDVSRAAHVSKYVTGACKMMEKVTAGTAYMEKVNIMLAGSQPATGMMQAYDAAGGSQFSSTAPKRARISRRNATAAGVGSAGETAVVRVWSRVDLPPGPQQRVQGSGKGAGAAIMQAVLAKQGLLKSDMRRILDQLEHFQGQDEAVVQGLADAMTLYNYPPNSLLYATGATCNEFMVLLSGQVVVHPESGGGHYVRLPPGTVLGLELMTQRLRSPCDVRTDPNFECRIAGLSWQAYGEQLRAWAANKVLSHTPGLQFTAEARVRAAIAKHATHRHCQPGQPVYSEHDAADSLVLLVKGQVVVSQLVEDTTQTEGQVAQQLQATLVGFSDVVVPSEIPRIHQPRSSLAGSHAARGMRASAAGRVSLMPVDQSTVESTQVQDGAREALDNLAALSVPPDVLASEHPALPAALQPHSTSLDGPQELSVGLDGGADSLQVGMLGAAASQQGACVPAGVGFEAPPEPWSQPDHVPKTAAAAQAGLQVTVLELSELEHEASLSLGAASPTHVATPVEGCFQSSGEAAGDGAHNQHDASMSPAVRQQGVVGCPAGQRTETSAAGSPARPDHSNPTPDPADHSRTAGTLPASTSSAQAAVGSDPFEFSACGSQQGAETASGPGAAGSHGMPDQLESAPSLAFLGRGSLITHLLPTPPDSVPPAIDQPAGDDQPPDSGPPGDIKPAGSHQELHQEVDILMSEPIFGVDSMGGGFLHNITGVGSMGVDLSQNMAGSTDAGVDGAAVPYSTVAVTEMGLGGDLVGDKPYRGLSATPTSDGYASDATSERTGASSIQINATFSTSVSEHPHHTSLLQKLTGHSETMGDHVSPGSTNGPNGEHAPKHHLLRDQLAVKQKSNGRASPLMQPHSGAAPAPSSAAAPATNTASTHVFQKHTASHAAASPTHPVPAGGSCKEAAPVDESQKHTAAAGTTEQYVKNDAPQTALQAGPSSTTELQSSPSNSHGGVSVPPEPVVSERAPPPPPLKGVPLHNALAALLKCNRQQVLAVHTTSIFLGEECLREPADNRHAGYHHTVLALQPVEVLCIPRALLVSSLPFHMAEELQKRAAVQRTRAAFKKTSASATQGGKQWPEAAPMLRTLLATPAGARAQWQVEQLADAFSSIPALASLPWQARVRVFQDLTLKQLSPDSPGLLLAQTVYQAVTADGFRSSQPGVDDLPSHINATLFDGLLSDNEQPQISDAGHSLADHESDALSARSGQDPFLPITSDYANLHGEPCLQPLPVGLSDAQSWFARIDSTSSNGLNVPHPTSHSSIVANSVPADNQQHVAQSILDGQPCEAATAAAAQDVGHPAAEAERAKESPVSFPTLPSPGSPSLLVPRLALQQQQGCGDRSGTRGSLLTSGSMRGWDGANDVAFVTHEATQPTSPQTSHDLSVHHQVAQLSMSQSQHFLQQGSDSARTSLEGEGSIALSSGRMPEPGTPLVPAVAATHGHSTTLPRPSQPIAGLQDRGTGALDDGCPSFTFQAVNLKKDDQLYIVVSGAAAIAAVLEPNDAETAVKAVQQAQQAAGSQINGIPWCDPLQPVILANVGLGATISAAQALELSELQPPGAPEPFGSLREAAAALAASGTAPELVPAVPGTRQVLAVQQGAQPLELLFMSRPLFALALNGAGRAARMQEVNECLEQNSNWTTSLWQHFSNDSSGAAYSNPAGQLGPEVVAKKLFSSCRVEEYHQGTELLRRGEPAPVVYCIISGECALHASYVGLAEADGAGAAALHELTRLKAGSSCGELSLLAARPLWYSLVVASPTATLLSIDLPVLRQLVASHLTPLGADGLLRAVAAVDLKLYASAIHKQALLVAEGTLDLGLFNTAARTLILQVMDLGDLQQSEASDTGHAAGAGGCQGIPAAVVIEEASKVDDVVSSLSRSCFTQPNIHEQAAVMKAAARARQLAAAQANLDEGSDITNVAADLPLALSVGPALLQQSMALYRTSHAMAATSKLAAHMDDCVLHVSMPTASTEEVAYKKPCAVRPPRQFDRRPLPKPLRGSELEFDRRPLEDMLPLSLLTAQQVLDLVRVKVHVKRSALSQVSELLQQHRPGTPQEPPSDHVDNVSGMHYIVRQRPRSASSCHWSDPQIQQSNKFNHLPAVVNASDMHAEVAARQLCRASASMLFPQSFARRTMRRESHMGSTSQIMAASSLGKPTSMHASVGFGLPEEPSDADQPATGWAAHPKVLPALRARVQSSVYRQVAAAASIKLRAKRKMHRSLTAAIWDDSEHALEELLAGDGGIDDESDEDQDTSSGFEPPDTILHSMGRQQTATSTTPGLLPNLLSDKGSLEIAAGNPAISSPSSPPDRERLEVAADGMQQPIVQHHADAAAAPVDNKGCYEAGSAARAVGGCTVVGKSEDPAGGLGMQGLEATATVPGGSQAGTQDGDTGPETTPATAAAEPSLTKVMMSQSEGSLSGSAVPSELSFAVQQGGLASSEPSLMLPQTSMPSLVVGTAGAPADTASDSSISAGLDENNSSSNVGNSGQSYTSSSGSTSGKSSRDVVATASEPDGNADGVSSAPLDSVKLTRPAAGAEELVKVERPGSAARRTNNDRVAEMPLQGMALAAPTASVAAVPSQLHAEGGAAVDIRRSSRVMITEAVPLELHSLEQRNVAMGVPSPARNAVQPGSAIASPGVASRKAEFMVPSSEDSTFSASASCADQQDASGPAAAELSRRGMWVRDAMYDPAGITNPLMAGLLTEAAQQAVGGSTGVSLQVTLPAPLGSLPSPRLQDKTLSKMSRGGLTQGLLQTGGMPATQQGTKAVGTATMGPGLGKGGQQSECTSSLARSALLRKRLKQQQASQLAADLHHSIDQQGCPTHRQFTSQGGVANQRHGTDAGASQGQATANVDAEALLAQDMMFVTLEVPPKVKTTPEITFTQGTVTSGVTPNVRVLPPAPKQGVHMAAAMAAVSLGETLRGGDMGGGYVPAFLKSKRKPIVAPPRHKVELGKQQWVVPTYSSKAGFLEGLYDEEAEVMYFDS